MFEAPERVCMFEALKRVCMPPTYIHTNQTYIHSKLTPGFRKAFEHVCMFGSPVFYHGNETYIHSQSCLKSKQNHLATPPKHVCMFQNPVFCRENETYTLQHTRSAFIEKRQKARLKKPLHYVCMFEIPVFCHGKRNIHART